jgi:hypothetical protein
MRSVLSKDASTSIFSSFVIIFSSTKILFYKLARHLQLNQDR